QSLEHRRGVTPDTDHCSNLTARAQGQILPDEPVVCDDGRARIRFGDGHDRGLGGATDRKPESLVSGNQAARRRWIVSGKHATVEQADFDPQDLPGRGQGAELLLQTRELSRRRTPARLVEKVDVEMRVDERADGRRVAAYDVVQC